MVISCATRPSANHTPGFSLIVNLFFLLIGSLYTILYVVRRCFSPIRLLYCILFLFSFGFSLKGAEPDVLNFAIGEYSPSISEKLPGFGFMTQIVTAAFKAEGIDVSYTFYPWARVWNNLVSGVSDGSLGYLRTEEREKHVLFSDVIWDQSYSAAFFLKEAGLSIDSPEDLSGLVAIIQRGYSYGTAVDELIKSGQIRSIYADTEEQAFQMVRLKRADVYLTNNTNGLYTIKKLYPEEDILDYGNYDSGVDNAQFYMIITRKNPQARYLIGKFNSGLKKIRKSGKYTEITADYTVR